MSLIPVICSQEAWDVKLVLWKMDGLWSIKLRIICGNRCRTLMPDPAGLGSRRQVPASACLYPKQLFLGDSLFLAADCWNFAEVCRDQGSIPKFLSLPSVYSKKRCVCRARHTYVVVSQISISSGASHLIQVPGIPLIPQNIKLFSS